MTGEEMTRKAMAYGIWSLTVHHFDLLEHLLANGETPASQHELSCNLVVGFLEYPICEVDPKRQPEPCSRRTHIAISL